MYVPGSYSCKLLIILSLLLLNTMYLTAWSQSSSRIADTPVVNRLLERASKIKEEKKDSAIYLNQKAIELSKDINYPLGLVRGYLNQGEVHFLRGNIKAVFYYNQLALVLSNMKGYDTYAEMACMNIATIYHSQGNYETAAAYYYKYIQNAENKVKNGRWEAPEQNLTLQNLVRAYVNLATLFKEMGNDKKALFYLSKAETLAGYKGDNEGMIFALTNKGFILLDLDSIAAAELACLKVYSISRKYNIRWASQLSAILMGNIYVKKKEPQKAVPFYERVIAIRDGTSQNLLLAYTSLGSICFDQHNYTLAQQNLETARKFAGQMDDQKAIMELSLLLSKVYSSQGKYKMALTERDRYEMLKDSLDNAEKNKTVNTLDVKYRTAEKDKDLTQKQLLITQQQVNITRQSMWIWGISAIALIITIFFIFFFVHRQRMQAEKIRTLKQEEEVRMLISTMKGEEKERTRLARDLHDGIGGLLSTLKTYFYDIQRSEPVLLNNTDYTEAMQILDETLAEVRKTSHNLMPELLFNSGLTEAVRIFCHTIQKAYKIKVDFQHYGVIGRLNNNLELFTYRIIQELINNIIKHANATGIIVQLSLHDHVLGVIVEDNGIGIGSKERSMDGIGMQTIQTRVRELAGHFAIHSTENKGTSVYIEFDLKNEKQLAL